MRCMRQDITDFHVGEDIVIDISAKDRVGNPLATDGTIITFAIGKTEYGSSIAKFDNQSRVTLIDQSNATYQLQIPAAEMPNIKSGEWNFYTVWSVSATGEKIVQAHGALILGPAVQI